MEFRQLGGSGLRVPAFSLGRTVTQIALNWLLQRPTVASVILRARTEAQRRENLGAIGWALTPDQMAALDEASAVTPIYPYWHQRSTMGGLKPRIVWQET